jgi:hypothetical protein
MKPDIRTCGDVIQHKCIGTVIHCVLDKLKYRVLNKLGLPYTLVFVSSFTRSCIWILMHFCGNDLAAMPFFSEKIYLNMEQNLGTCIPDTIHLKILKTNIRWVHGIWELKFIPVFDKNIYIYIFFFYSNRNIMVLCIYVAQRSPTAKMKQSELKWHW